jgi:hypothetical protein
MTVSNDGSHKACCERPEKNLKRSSRSLRRRSDGAAGLAGGPGTQANGEARPGEDRVLAATLAVTLAAATAAFRQVTR